MREGWYLNLTKCMCVGWMNDTALEKLSKERTRTYTESMKQKQHVSAHQTVWLEALIRKHGGPHNTVAMARDRQLNRDQKTEGEIRRLIAKLNHH